MGRPKALLPFRGETFLDHLIALFSGFCDPVIVVLGHNYDEIRGAIRSAPRSNPRVVNNPDYPLGQLSSMQCGLRAVPAESEAVLFTLVDHPDPSPTTIRALLDSPALISVPAFGGRKGHPVLFRRELIPEFLALRPELSAKDVFRRYALETSLVEVDDPGILDDIDDPEAWRMFQARVGRQAGQ